MRNEIIKLLKKEGKLSDDAIDEIKKVDIHDFANIVEEIGKQKTDYIDASEISQDLNTKYVGKNPYFFCVFYIYFYLNGS